MPHEDFVYLGDGARLPYGPRPLDEVRRFALEIGALPRGAGREDGPRRLQHGDVRGAARAAGGARRAGRRRDHARGARGRAGDAQPPDRPARDRGTVEAGRYERLVHTLDASVALVPLACPRLVPLIESDDPFGAATVDAVREYAAPLKEEDVDTVILGCTHYPLIRNIFQRVFGRGVTLVFSADETAREVAETLARKGIENDPQREGEYRFLTTGRPRRSARLARASCSCRSPRSSTSSWPSSRPSHEREGRRPDELRPLAIELDYLEQPHGAVLFSQGKTKVLCTAMIEDEIPRWLKNSGRGWMTAEYSLLPASTGERVQREVSRGRAGGRTVEIQRLIGRALRVRGRLRGARRAHGLARLRRAPGRRRHTLRRDLGRVRRGAARARPVRALARARRLGRRGLGRDRRRRAAPRSRVHRGLDAPRWT